MCVVRAGIVENKDLFDLAHHCLGNALNHIAQGGLRVVGDDKDSNPGHGLISYASPILADRARECSINIWPGKTAIAKNFHGPQNRQTWPVLRMSRRSSAQSDFSV